MSERSFPSIGSSPPRVRLGFVGARTLPKETAWLDERLTEVWTTSAAWSATASGEMLRLASGMANGADSLAVRSYCDWRDTHSALPHELLLIYPCAVNDFRERSEKEKIDGFDVRRTAVIAKPYTFELVLDGEMPRSRPDPAAGKAINDEQMKREERIRAAAHRYQSEVLIRQCEFLVAVIDREQEGEAGGTRETIDREQEREAGGTRETIERAMSMDTPVLVIDPASEDVFLLRYIEELRADFSPQDRWQESWRSVLTKALGSSEILACGGIEVAYQAASGLKASKRWDRFQSPFEAYAESYREALKNCLTGMSPTAPMPTLQTPSPWRSLWATLTGAIRMIRAKPIPLSPRSPISTIESWRGHVADHQSVSMAEYRSLFVSNYWLGFVAVMLALTSLIALALSALKPPFWLLAILLALAYAKYRIVRQIASNTHRAEAEHAGKLSVELRYIAERLRVMPFLQALGSARIDLVHQTPRRGRAHRVAEDFVRRLPLVDSLPAAAAGQRANNNASSRVNAPRGSLEELIAFIAKQIDHHVRTHATMTAVHRMLERAIGTCGWLVIGIVAIDIAVIVSKLVLKSPLASYLIADASIVPIGNVLSIVGVALVFVTALLPALMATLNGILFQSQAEQLADRHGAMAGALSLLLVEARQLQTHAPTFGISASHAVLNLSERTYRLMAEEVGEWATMYSQGLRET